MLSLILYGMICFSPILSFKIENNGESGVRKESEPDQLGRLNNYEIIVPHRLEGKRHRRSLNTLHQGSHIKTSTFILKAFGYNYELLVSLNEGLLPLNATEKFYLQDGTPIVRRQSQTEHCYYHGSVKNIPNSLVMLSTCNGLDGLVIVPGGETFLVEPLQGSSDNKHVVYRMEDVKGWNNSRKGYRTCESGGGSGHTSNLTSYFDASMNSSFHGQFKTLPRGKRDTHTKTKYVELYIINDNKEFIKHDEDTARVIERTKYKANIVDALYKPLNVRITLVGVEVWSNDDQFEIDEGENIMNDFANWRLENLLHRFPNDVTHLITGVNFFDRRILVTPLFSICSSSKSVAIDESADAPDHLVAITIAHELGHNLGMEHDIPNYCSCPDEHCIMTSSSSKTLNSWSKCSKDALANAENEGLYACLYNQPENIYGAPICGNDILEDGEECDCGTNETCDNNCCNPSTCKLYSYATCASGDCCDNECHFKARGALCRAISGMCDLPEYCTGLSPSCPDDVYRQVGILCSKPGEETAHCYQGACNSREQQCKELYGPGAFAAHRDCYKLNQRGDEYGDCGHVNYNYYDENGGFISRTTLYSPCELKDNYCGKLQCKKGLPTSIISSPYRQETISTVFQEECKSVSFDLGSNVHDLGLVKQGASCEGSGKMCINMKCQSWIDNLGMVPCPRNCSNHGVCNSNNNCHCDRGWLPPLCNIEDPWGWGSIDSGNNLAPTSPPPEASPLSLAAVILCLTVPFFSAIGIFIYWNRKNIYNKYLSWRTPM